MPTVHRKPFGHAHGQTEVDLWTLDSGTGVRAEVLTYGAVLHSLTVPDTAGVPGPVVRSLPAIDDYTDKNPYFGAVVGRYANRIAHGRFTLDGTTHHIPANDRGHALHGGPDGFHTKVWDAAGDRTGSAAVLRLTLHSPHGDMGFPGALDVTATYTLDTTGTLALEYTAVTDRPTVVNLTNHAYLNLGADGILGHTLQVDADHYLPIDTGSIPEGPRPPSPAPRSTSPPRSRWGTPSPGPTPNSPWPAASTTAGCCANRPPPHSAGPPASPPPATGAPWSSGRPNRGSRSTPATSSTARSPTAPAAATNATDRSAWRPSTCPTHPTAPPTPARCCAPAKPSAAAPNGAFRTCARKKIRLRSPTAL